MTLIKRMRNGRLRYMRPCLGCETPVLSHNQRCKSCEMRRRHKAGLMQAPPPKPRKVL